MENIRKFIINYVEKKGKLPNDADLEAFDFVKSGHIDSMALFKFVVDIEAEFDIEISDEEMISSEFRTIGGLVSIISDKAKNRKP